MDKSIEFTHKPRENPWSCVQSETTAKKADKGKRTRTLPEALWCVTHTVPLLHFYFELLIKNPQQPCHIGLPAKHVYIAYRPTFYRTVGLLRISEGL